MTPWETRNVLLVTPATTPMAVTVLFAQLLERVSLLRLHALLMLMLFYSVTLDTGIPGMEPPVLSAAPELTRLLFRIYLVQLELVRRVPLLQLANQ